MKRATIILPGKAVDFSTIAGISGAFEIFNTANRYREQTGNQPLFKIELAGTSTMENACNGMFTVRPQIDFTQIIQTDLIIIPSVMPAFQTSADDDTGLLRWLQQQYKNGAEIACMCSGAFILASSGLLDGKSCSTHWAHAAMFSAQFPKVTVLSDRLITDENGILTNGGAYSFLNLMMYLVEKYYDRPTAIYCSKIFQIEIDRNSQSPFSIFTGQKQHADEMVQQAQAYIEKSIDEKISFETLAAKFAVGRRNFDRRFIKATGNTPVEYAQRVKIEAAKKFLEVTRKTINEVMYDVGYSDLKAFRELFRKITGMSPLAYRSKYNKEAAVLN